MADVAARAGVSPATVARVIYSNGYVKGETRLIVESAVRETGYRPNVVARALRTSRSFTLGLVLTEYRLNAFHVEIAHEVQHEALKHGYCAFTLNSGGDAEVERAGVQRFLDQHVDAVLFCTAVDPANVRLIKKARIPTVLIERGSVDLGRLALVDSAPGMNEAVAHLSQLGHERIAFIGGRKDLSRLEAHSNRSAEAIRVRCFETALAAMNIRVREEFIRLGEYYAARDESQPGYVHMRALLALPEPPTAVITGADSLAAGALQAIGAAGLSVPHDVSVIGYDDTIAEILTPPLTSIAQPIKELARAAVGLALEAIHDAGTPATSPIFPTHLIVRQSTAAPK